MPRGILLSSNLPQLQNLIKRDPIAYKEEFLQQWNHYNSIRQIFNVQPEEHAQTFRELVAFVAQVATCYPKETAQFPSHISLLLLEDYSSLSPDTRKTLVQNLVMLRNKDVVSSIDLLKCLFPLLPRTTSPTLRTFIRKTILSDIRTSNMRSKNHKLNRTVQAMLFNMVERGVEGDVGDKDRPGASTTERTARNGEEAMWAVILTKELWRKGVWADAKTVSILSLGVFHPVTRVQSASAHFFLGSDQEKEDSDEETQEELDVRTLHHRRDINKKTRSGDKKMQKILNVAKKKHYSRPEGTVNVPAVQLLNDPQSFAEKLYDTLSRHDKRFSLDHKILLIQLLSRVMGAHQLCVLGLYTFIIKYLTHRQLRVPAILAALAQSVHELTPPDAITPVIRRIAQEFVHPGVGSEVVAAGLNAIREICRRQSWSMEEDLLGDLVEYRKSRDKTVTAAARGLLQLYREINPGMLRKRERGKDASVKLASGAQALPFGHRIEPAVDIEGLFLLEDHLQKLGAEDAVGLTGDDDSAWYGWDIQYDSSGGSENETWIDVDDDAECLSISDMEDESSHVDDTTGRISTLATTKILTPADFALLNDLRTQAANETVDSSRRKRKLIAREANKYADSRLEDSFLSELDILGPRKKVKSDYAERVASIQKGREGREKFRSNKGKVNKELPSSSTNREKARNKPIMMILGSGVVCSKKKSSLRQKQRKLRAHIERAKKARR